MRNGMVRIAGKGQPVTDEHGHNLTRRNDMFIMSTFTAATIFFNTLTFGVGVIGGEYEGYKPLVQRDAKTASSIH